MGNWAAHVEGHGIHDNGLDGDAEAILAKFVAALRDAGHHVSLATFHAGSGKHLPADASGQADHTAGYVPNG